jgi:hypothetical protein
MGYMTKYERLALTMTSNLMQVVSGLLSQDAAKSELLSLHLPNLSQAERDDLKTDSKDVLAIAQQWTEHAKTLTSILEQNP